MTERIAFVTGASRGIGKASALALARAGFDVVVTARTVKEGQRFDYSPTFVGSQRRALPGSVEITAREIQQLGRRALPLRLDLLDRASIDLALAATEEEWGPIHLLLNNGIFQGPGLMERFLDVPQDALQRIFEANVFAQIHLTQQVARSMLAVGGGTIINMTSNAARHDPPGPIGQGGWGFAYAASKAAFHRMVGMLHVELHDAGVRAYNLDPGYVVTESARTIRGENSDLDQAYHGVPPEVPAAAVAWLAQGNETARSLAGKTLLAARLCEEQGLLKTSSS